MPLPFLHNLVWENCLEDFLQPPYLGSGSSVNGSCPWTNHPGIRAQRTCSNPHRGGSSGCCDSRFEKCSQPPLVHHSAREEGRKVKSHHPPQVAGPSIPLDPILKCALTLTSTASKHAAARSAIITLPKPRPQAVSASAGCIFSALPLIPQGSLYCTPKPASQLSFSSRSSCSTNCRASQPALHSRESEGGAR
jgi:hypothetical protein